MKRQFLFTGSILLNILFIAVLVVLIFTGSYGRPIIHHVNQNFTGRTSLFSELPKISGKTVFIGDSMIARCEWSELFQDPAVVNRGIGGDSTAGVMKRIGDVAAMKPGKLFIMAGINDIAMGINPSRIEDNYRRILETVHRESPETRAYIQSILPIHEYRVDVPPERVDTVNARLRRLAERENAVYLDIASRVRDSTGRLREDLTYDGVHLTGEGYLIWKKSIEGHVH